MKNTLLFLLIFPLSALSIDGKVNFKTNSLTNVITVQIENQDHAVMVQIVSEDGSVVWTEHTKESEFKLNLNYYPEGAYTVNISVYDKVESHYFVKR